MDISVFGTDEYEDVLMTFDGTYPIGKYLSENFVRKYINEE